MLGHAPFLGQVRLVSSPYPPKFWMGQEGLPTTSATDPEGFMPYNGLLFTQLLEWASVCTSSPPGATALAERFKVQYFGNKEVSQDIQTPIRLSDVERSIVNEVKGCVSKSCNQIGTVKSWMVDETLRLREEQETAAGRQILRIPTGKIYGEGSRSEAHEYTVWSCPSSVDTGRPSGSAPPGTPSGARPQATPTSSNVLPVVAGVGVVGLLVAVAAGAFR